MTQYVEVWSILGWVGLLAMQLLVAAGSVAARLCRGRGAALAREPRYQLHGLAYRPRDRRGGRRGPRSRPGDRRQQYRRGRRAHRRRAPAALSDAGPAEEPGSRRRCHRDGGVRHLVRATVRPRGLILVTASRSFRICRWRATKSATNRTSRRRLRPTRRPFTTPTRRRMRWCTRPHARRFTRSTPRRRRSSAACSTRAASASTKPSEYLGAIGPMDAVGYHPYLYDVTTMEQDTLALRQWLDANGHGGVPLDINEFGAAGHQHPSTGGSRLRIHPVGAVHAGARRRGRPGILVGGQSRWPTPRPGSRWSAARFTDPLGTAYLGEVSALTSQGCPAPAPVPSTTTHAVVPTSKRAKPHKTHKPAKRAHHRKRRRPVKASHDKRWRPLPPRKSATRVRR